MKWVIVFNWLFSLIWDQSLPHELWFWLKGKLRGMATSFPKFTTRVQAAIACGHFLLVCSRYICLLPSSPPLVFTSVSGYSLRNTVSLQDHLSIHL